MNTQQLYKALATWLRENTADLSFKRASLYEEAVAEEYSYTLTAPAIYELMLPMNAAEHEREKEDLPITAPSIIIQNGGEITYSTQNGRAEFPILLLVNTWNPGKHTETENGERGFTPDGEGWRDCVHLMDTIKNRLANAEFPAGCELTGNITISPPSHDDQTFPYYFGTLQFTLATFRRFNETKFDI